MMIFIRKDSECFHGFFTSKIVNVYLIIEINFQIQTQFLIYINFQI